MKRLWYAVKGLEVDKDNNLHEPILVSSSLTGAIKDWRKNHTIKTARVEVRQDTNSGYRIAGELAIEL